MAWHVLVILFALGLQHIHVCPCVCETLCMTYIILHNETNGKQLPVVLNLASMVAWVLDPIDCLCLYYS